MSQHRAEHVELLKQLIERYPATVNARQPASGKGLLQFVCEEAHNPSLLQLLLSAHCRIGLQPDRDRHTLLSAALHAGQQQMLRCVLRALVKGQFSAVAGTDHLIAECFLKLAHHFPRELLDFVSQMPLQPEQEVRPAAPHTVPRGTLLTQCHVALSSPSATWHSPHTVPRGTLLTQCHVALSLHSATWHSPHSPRSSDCCAPLRTLLVAERALCVCVCVCVCVCTTGALRRCVR